MGRRNMLEVLDDVLEQDIDSVQESSPFSVNPLIGAKGLIENLSDNQQRFLTAKLWGMTDAAAARAIEMTPATVYGWKTNDEDFKLVYDAVTTNPILMALETTAFGLAKAIGRLTDMLDHPNVRVVQYAIDKLIQIGGLEKTRMEVTHRNDTGDIDAIVQRIEARRIESRTDGGRDSEV